MNNDLISREALKAEFKRSANSVRNWKEGALNNGNEESAIRADAVLVYLTEVKGIIDNAPPVEAFTKEDMAGAYNEGYACGSRENTRLNEQIAWEQGYEAGLAQGKHDKMSDNKSLCDTCLYGHCCENSDVGIRVANHLVCYGYVADVIDENEKGGAE